MSAKRVRARRASDTRWLYRVEDEMFRYNGPANAERSMAFLRALARRVWRACGNGRALPSINAGAGLRWQGRLTSYCAGFTEIVLARHHRNIVVLLHELTHALGPCLHGPKFIRVYFPLLQRFAGYNRWFLEGVAATRGVRL